MYTLLRSTRSTSASLHLFFPPSVCVLRHRALFPIAPITYCPFFFPPSSLTCLFLPPSLPPLFPQSLALFDWTLSQDSLSCVQVKLLIASAAGGGERQLTAAQPVPVRGAVGLLGRRWGSISVADWSRQCREAGDKDLLIKMMKMTPDSRGKEASSAPKKREKKGNRRLETTRLKDPCIHEKASLLQPQLVVLFRH